MHRIEGLGELVVADRLAVAADPLVDPVDVRAHVGADRQADSPTAAR